MIRIRLLGAALLLALGFSAPAAARDQVNGRDAVTIDPGKSYIFFRTTERSPLMFFREVTPAQLAAHERSRGEAFAQARRRYERDFALWQRDQQECGGGRTGAFCRGERVQRPAEVTEANFVHPIPLLGNFVTVSPGPQFTRADGAYTYLMAVEPGTYSVYGPIFSSDAAAMGYCLCMGSVRFEAQAGRIVDLGEVRYPRADAIHAGTRNGALRRFRSIEILPYQAAMTRPDRLNGLPVDAANFRAADKVPNYFGVWIDRMAPMPGVLAYDRDRIVDLQAGGAAAGQ